MRDKSVWRGHVVVVVTSSTLYSHALLTFGPSVTSLKARETVVGDSVYVQ